MKKIHLLIFIFTTTFCSYTQEEPYKSNKTYTLEAINFEYETLAKNHPAFCKFENFGPSDYGLPISLFVINKSGIFTPREFNEKCVLLINNAIHPGEPCGVDASVKLAKDLLKDTALIPDNVVIAIIPIYNIGGAMNRNCCSRTNQNGPEEYGFRGNAKNLDLNRDFIKADSKNTLTFYKIFHYLNPNVFIDTHTSDGADYQHTMTLITSQVNKMHPYLAEFTDETLNPHLYAEMEKTGFPMVPYVHMMDQTPDKGIMDYLETPRYSTGYTNLFNTLSYVTEAHMLKSFEERVESTYAFLKIMMDYMDKEHEKFLSLKRKADYDIGSRENFDIAWELDTTRFEEMKFMGYEAEYHKSEVTGLDRLFYNQKKPYKKMIKYYHAYKPTVTVKRPEYYVIPKSWGNIIPLFKANNIMTYQLKKDKQTKVEVYYITHFETSNSPYEGHYLHHSIEVRKDTQIINYNKGDYVVPTRNPYARFIVETLEPQATDSYLVWNYFDAVLQQKEWFSPYVFEEKAAEILTNDPDLNKEFEEKKRTETAFAESAWLQLYFIYQNSEHYEPTHNQYPVTRAMDEFMSDEIEEVIRFVR